MILTHQPSKQHQLVYCYLCFHPNELNIVTRNIGNAYLKALTDEKVYSYAGPEFGAKEGCIAILKHALNGLKINAINGMSIKWTH